MTGRFDPEIYFRPDLRLSRASSGKHRRPVISKEGEGGVDAEEA